MNVRFEESATAVNLMTQNFSQNLGLKQYVPSYNSGKILLSLASSADPSSISDQIFVFTEDALDESYGLEGFEADFDRAFLERLDPTVFWDCISAINRPTVIVVAGYKNIPSYWRGVTETYCRSVSLLHPDITMILNEYKKKFLSGSRLTGRGVGLVVQDKSNRFKYLKCEEKTLHSWRKSKEWQSGKGEEPVVLGWYASSFAIVPNENGRTYSSWFVDASPIWNRYESISEICFVLANILADRAIVISDIRFSFPFRILAAIFAKEMTRALGYKTELIFLDSIYGWHPLSTTCDFYGSSSRSSLMLSMEKPNLLRFSMSLGGQSGE